MLKATSTGVGQMQYGGIGWPVRHPEEGMMLFGNTLHIGHKGLETLSVWNVPTAVPPLEVVRSAVNIVGQRCVRVDFHDAVEQHVPVW